MILGGFIQIMEEMSEYLLNPCQLILEPEYIYLDAERKSVRFCYLPGFHGKYRNSFRVLRSISFQSWIMKTEKRSCWDIMYTDVHWRTVFIWNTSRKSYIKYVSVTRKIFLHMKKENSGPGRKQDDGGGKSRGSVAGGRLGKSQCVRK